MSRHDLIVIGAGPAGAEATITARSLGLDVVVIDEAEDAGGQIYHPGPASSHSEGRTLRERLRQSGARLAFDHRVWTISQVNDGFEVAAVGAQEPLVISASAA